MDIRPLTAEDVFGAMSIASLEKLSGTAQKPPPQLVNDGKQGRGGVPGRERGGGGGGGAGGDGGVFDDGRDSGIWDIGDDGDDGLRSLPTLQRVGSPPTKVQGSRLHTSDKRSTTSSNNSNNNTYAGNRSRGSSDNQNHDNKTSGGRNNNNRTSPLASKGSTAQTGGGRAAGDRWGLQPPRARPQVDTTAPTCMGGIRTNSRLSAIDGWSAQANTSPEFDICDMTLSARNGGSGRVDDWGGRFR